GVVGMGRHVGPGATKSVVASLLAETHARRASSPALIAELGKSPTGSRALGTARPRDCKLSVARGYQYQSAVSVKYQSTVTMEKIQSTTDAGSLNTFGRNEIEVAPISSALLRIACLVILYKTCRVPDQELAADGVSGPV